MTTLRALLGAGSVLAYMGLVVFVPVGWALVLYAAEKTSAEQLKVLPGITDAYTEKHIKWLPFQRKAELVQKEILPRAAFKRIMYQRVAKDK